MDDRERRFARNEALFREVNERIGEVAASHGDGDVYRYEFFCECGNADCTFVVELSRAEYEGVRRNPRRFIVRPTHDVPEVEKVVEQHDDYWVVEKEDEAAEYVERLDPRSREGEG